MKKQFYFITFLLISYVACGQVSDHFSSEVSDFKITSKSPYTIIESTKSSNFASQVGAPQLPVISRNYLLPAGSVVTNVSFTNGIKTLLGDNLLIYPTQPTISINSPSIDFVPPDTAIYTSVTPFPNVTVNTSNDGSKFGYHIVTLTICPFQYIPSEKKLYFYNEINYTISYSIGSLEDEVRITANRNQLTKDNMRSFVQNPEMITPNSRPSYRILENNAATDKLIIPWKPSNFGTVPDFVIITNELLKGSFKTLADYKIQKGIPTVIATVEDIYKNYSGLDNAEKIRNYLKAAHKYWNVGLYVLLGGDTSIVPGRMASFYDGENNYSDLYYGDVFKPGIQNLNPTNNYNWNSNGDATFGAIGNASINDGCELLAENIVGRAPVDTVLETDNFIEKIINYERLYGVSDQTYVNNMLFLGAYYDYNQNTQTGTPEGQEWHFLLAQKPFLANPTLKKWLVFDDPIGSPYHNFPGNQELSHDSALGNLKNGHDGDKFHLVSHLDHGYPYTIGASFKKNGEVLNNADMDGLDNDPYYKIMYSTACLAGSFQEDCIAEHFVNATRGGGVAMLANSGTVGTGANEQDNKFFESIYDPLSPDYILGLAFTNARDEVSGLGNEYRVKQMTLFGDPTMAVWSATPQTITFNSMPTSITINNANALANVLPVSINAISEEATVTLYKYNDLTSSIEVYASQKIPANSTTVEFALNPDTPGNLQVKVTARNYLPASTEVDIQLPQAHLYVTSYTINDNAPNGNGNGIIEQGETISIAIQLTNSGSTDISDINTTLSCLAAFGSVTNNQASTPQINAGQIVTLSGFTFVAQVEQAENPLPNFIEFMVNITASGSYVHLDNFYVDVKNPKLALGARIVTNDVGDTTIKNLNVFLNNIGNMATGTLNATLTTTLDNSIVQILQPIRTYEDWLPLTEQHNSSAFQYRVLSSYTGALPFMLTLNNIPPQGRSWSFTFDLSEGPAPSISGFNFTSTRDQITLKWNPIANLTNGNPSINGYNIYRSNELNGLYEKKNDFLITGSSIYNDTDVDNTSMSIYYYKISVVTLTGNESPLVNIVTTGTNPNLQGYKAWTTLENLNGFPIVADLTDDGVGFSSPTLFDVDNDGTKEIFVNYGNAHENDGKIMGFYSSGQELFDIDGDANTISGFASNNISMVTNSAIGDLDNDGYAEVLSVGRNNSANKGKVYVYKTIDNDGDGKPDKFWNDEFIDVQWKINTNPVLYDIDGNGFLDIIIVDEKQTVYVYDKNKNLLPGWPQEISILPGNDTVDLSEGHIAVADLDHDGKGEIAIGLKSGGNGTKGAIYIWRYNATPFTVNPFHEFADNERSDGTIVFADIDNDMNLDIITTTRKSNGSSYLGKIYAFKQDGTTVYPSWNGLNTMGVSQSNFITMPNIAVGDLNHDGSLEIVFGSKNKLYVLNKDGFSSNTSFPITIKESFSTPILADIDTDPDSEIIVNYDGKIYAYNFGDGSLCTGFPIEAERIWPFISSPTVDDLNNDGKNELVATTRDFTTYIFNTEGHSVNNEWSSYRGNPHNTGTYKEVCNSEVDLCIKDSPDDRGAEPNIVTEFMWASSDIWVRNNSNDNSTVHQNPIYRANGTPNHIKVRVTNKSCVASDGSKSVSLYWAKASTGLGASSPWEGGVYYNNALMGGLVGMLQIPPLQKGQEAILDFLWPVPNPALYGDDGNQWHFCLLAKIDGGVSDPYTFPLGDDLNQNVRNNNNIAWKNVTVIDVPTVITDEPAGVIAVSNPSDTSRTFYLEMAIADLETGKPIYDEAEVKIKMDEVLYRAWELGGKEAALLDPTMEEKRKIVKGNHVILDNIAFGPNDIGKLRLSFNFLTKELTEKTNYVYHVMQKDRSTGDIVGGETFIINKNVRPPFDADAGGDKVVDLNQSITISATDINEPAIYNWYDSAGNLIFQGKDLQIPNAIAEKYKLEVISTIDGFKDYSEVEVRLNPNRLNSLAPNSATDYVNVSYKLNEASSAYLMIVSYYMNGGISNNYVLNTNSNETTINLTTYPTGFYKVILVVNGNVVDAKLLFKQ